MSLPLRGICLSCGFSPSRPWSGYLVDGPFYLFLVVRRSINHARQAAPGGPTGSCRIKRACAATRRELRLFWYVYGVARILRLGQILRVNGTGELAGDGVLAGRVQAGPGGHADAGPARAAATRRHQKVIDTTPPAVALHALLLVRCAIDQVGHPRAN
jgi:hypothetical protein